MTFGTSSGTAQGNGGLPPVTSEDINPPAPDTGSESKDTAPKTDKQQDQSQPKSPQQQSTDGQQQSETPAKDKGPGPWQAKLAEMGITDPRVDEFFRNEVQPYITQLEQQGGQGNDVFEGDAESAAAAKDLLDALRANPEEAYRELGELLGLADSGMEGEGMDGMDPGMDPGLGDESGNPAEGEASDPRLDYVDDLIRREREQAEDAEYDQFLEQMGQRMPGFDADLFTTFVVASAGNLDAAMTQYEKYHRAPDPVTQPPPSIDGGGTAPPEAPRYGSVGDAISGWMAEESASNPRR